MLKRPTSLPRWAIPLALLLLAALAALAWHLRTPAVTADPALWRISRGDRHAWLFGTIHAVPPGARWLSPPVEKAVAESDTLVLEAKGLEDERADRTIFEALGRSPGLPPIAARLDSRDRPRLAALVRSAPETLRDLDRYESWAAALLIGAATTRNASQDEAAEATLEQSFRARNQPVLGLETIKAQLGLFDTLPEPDQRAMLAQAVEEADDGPAQFEALYARWAAGDLKSLEALFLAPLARFPTLRAALIDRRNAAWAEEIDKNLTQNGKIPFIAVGTGHLIGPGSVQDRLSALGWHVQRIR